jgi:hypothetical protein
MTEAPSKDFQVLFAFANHLTMENKGFRLCLKQTQTGEDV